MILFTVGMPCSGKTLLSKEIIKRLDNKYCLHLNAKDYFPDDYHHLDNEAKNNISISSWKIIYEKASKSVIRLPNKVLIIFDSCCSNYNSVRQLFINAKIKKHDIFSVFVKLDNKIRDLNIEGKIKRTDQKYKDNLVKSLPIIREMSDHFLIIDATDLNNNKKLDILINKIKNIRREENV